MEKYTSKTLKYFWSHIRYYKMTVFAILFCFGLGVLINDVYIPIKFKEIIDVISDSGLEKDEIFEKLKAILLTIFIFFVLVELVIFRLGALANVYFQSSIIKRITDDCFSKLQNHSYSFFTDNFSGSLVAKIKRMFNSFEAIADNVVWNFYVAAVRLGASLIVLFVISPVLSYILVIWTIIYIAALALFSKWKMKYDIKVASLDSKLTGELADAITNSTTVKLFSRQKYENERLANTTEKKRAAQSLSWKMNEILQIFKGISMSIVEVLMLYAAVYLWYVGKTTIGSIFLVHAYVLPIMHNLWHLNRAIIKLYSSLSDANEMMELLLLPNEVVDVDNPENCKIKKGKIEFKNVNFSYNQKSHVFKNLSFEIESGRKIGIVGESGAGKSTLISLLLRFKNLKEGKILIDGQDISQIKQNDLRRKISFVPQEPILFHRSLYDNILYGDLDVSEENVYEAAKNAQAHNFISNTIDKYKTLVGERGIKLSGGERQRIAIARSMLKNTPILILDEATSSLDSRAEKDIQIALENIMKNRTTLVIAHRLSTLKMLDEIIVFDKGKIVERGSHEILLKNYGKYHELWNHQVGGFIN